jgi:hypothetical protein
LTAAAGWGVVITNNNLVCSGYYPENQSTPNVGTLTLYGENVVINPSLTVNGAITNNSLTANKFLKSDNNKIITSADITINDVDNLSTRLSQNEAKTATISLTSSGSPFTAPNQGASLIPVSSANPSFKIKGLTSSNNILLMVSADSVDVTIDPLLTNKINVLDSNFLNGLLIPSTISPGSNGQVLSSDGKIAVWRTPATTLQIPFKMFYGPNLDPPLVTDSKITLMNLNSFSGSSIFPIGFFQQGQIIKIKITGSIVSGANGSNTWSVYFNNTISFSYTHPTITTGANLSAFTCEITCPIAISSGTNVNIYNTTAIYMQGKNGESPQNPQCMTALAVGSGTSNLVTNDLNVRFRQSVPANNILNVYNAIYEVY